MTKYIIAAVLVLGAGPGSALALDWEQATCNGVTAPGVLQVGPLPITNECFNADFGAEEMDILEAAADACVYFEGVISNPQWVATPDREGGLICPAAIICYGCEW